MAISALTAVLRGTLLRSTAVTLAGRAVAPAPFGATPDGPTCAAELVAHHLRSGSLPGDQFDQYCEVRLAAKVNDDTHKSMLSCLVSWLRGQPGALLSFPDDHRAKPHATCAGARTASLRQHAVAAQCGERRTVAALDDVDRTTRSRLSNARTRCHLLRARIAR